MADDPRIETGSLARQLPEEAHFVKRFSKFQDFVDEYSSRISLGGIFVRHDQLHPVGSQVYLDFRLEDDYRLLHGIGEVVWVRLKTMSEERPKGLGIRFASLDEDGRELVLKLLEEQVKGGGEPFEVDKVPEDGSIDPSVVQAMEGPSSEETEAAEQAKSAETAAREATESASDADEEDDEELPDLPPGVLPPPDEEADFSAPWGENLPDIPDDLLDESKKGEADDASVAAPPISVPSVEAPESPYEPGSKEADAEGDAEAGEPQAELALTPPDTADPMLDESDFGMPKTEADEDVAAGEPPVPEEPQVRPVGEATDLGEAAGDAPFGEINTIDTKEEALDGTLLTEDVSGEEEAPAPAAEDQPWEPEDFAAEEELSFDAGADEASFDVADEEPSFDAPSFDTPFEEGGEEAGELGSAGFDLDDDTSSAVVPPEDMGEAAGAAFSGDYEPAEEPAPEGPEPEETEESRTEELEETAATLPPATPPAVPKTSFDGDETGPASSAPSAAAERSEPAPDPAMDAAFDLDEGAFGDEELDTDLGEEAVAEPDAVAAEPEPVVATTAAGEASPTRFAGDTPAVSPADQAVSALPDLSDTVMGNKSPQPGSPETGSPEKASPETGPAEPQPSEPGEETWQEGAYEDWEDWAPQPASQGKLSFLVVVVILVLAGLGIAGYLYQDELLELVVGESTPVMSGGPATGPEPPVGMDPPPAEPATTPEGVEPLPEGADPAGSPDLVPGRDPYEAAQEAQAEELVDLAEEEDAARGAPEPAPEEPTTRAGADELRPPTGREEAAGDMPARRIADVDVSEGSRGTVVSIRFDGVVDSSRFLHDPLAWAPDREMVTLYGVENHPQTVIGAGTSELRRIRVGFHPGPELRLVFDLAGEGVSITSVESRGDLLRVRLGR